MSRLRLRSNSVIGTNGTTWTNTSNAIDGSYGANNATYATWTNATNGGTGYIELGFDTSSIPSSGVRIDSIKVNIRHYVSSTTNISAVAFQLYDNTTAIGASFTAQRATSARNDFYFWSPTLSQVKSANFKLRVSVTHGANSNSATFNLDYADIEIMYVLDSTPAELYTGSAWKKHIELWNGSEWRSDCEIYNGTSWVSLGKKSYWYNNADGGSNGTSTSESNTGGTSGDPFDRVQTAITFSSTQSHSGSLSYAVPSGSAQGYSEWYVGNSSMQISYQGWYYFTATPVTAEARIISFRDTTPATVGGLLITSARKFRLMQGTAGQAGTDSPAISTNAWYRVSLAIKNGTSGGTYAMKVHDSSLTEIHSVSGSFTGTAANFQIVQIFRPSTVDLGGVSYVDDLKLYIDRDTVID